MPNYTTNYKLKKPLPEEFYNIEDHNSNMDIIDEELKKLSNMEVEGDFIPTSEKGKPNGVATLDDNGKLPAEAFPEGVDGGSGKRTARFTVGSSQYGWTASDCDYLCDGTTDNVEINAAIQALRSTGGEVILLDGLYNLNSAILIDKDNVTLSGNGASTKIIRAFNDDEYDDKQGMIVIESSFCTIKNLYFDGVKGTYTSNTAINLYGGNNCTIADNTIVNSSCDGILVNGDYLTIDNNIITNCDGNGLYLYKGNKHVATNNKITGSGLYGIYVYNVKDATVSNNISTGNTDSGIKVYWSDRCTYTGNALNNNNQCGLYLTRGEGNVISGNTINGNKHYGVHLNSMTSKCVVMSNVYANNTSGEVEDVGTNNTIHLPSHTHDDIAKIKTGSYTGTGTSGSANPCTLTFPFAPKMVWIYSYYDSVNKKIDDYHSGNYTTKLPMDALSTSYAKNYGLGFNGVARYGKKSADSKTLYWYVESDEADGQFNANNNVYYYIAIG